MVFEEKSKFTLCYYSKTIADLIESYFTWDNKRSKTYSVRLKERNYTLSFMVGFLRGSIDSDGYFSKNKINFATVSPGLRADISSFLNHLGIAHSIVSYQDKRGNRAKIYHINLLRSSFSKFKSLIKPRNIKMHSPGFEYPSPRRPLRLPGSQAHIKVSSQTTDLLEGPDSSH